MASRDRPAGSPHRLGWGDQTWQRLVGELVVERHAQGLSQTEVAARMGTSQSAVARLEAGHDARISTVTRYLAAVGQRLEWRICPPPSSSSPGPAGTDRD